MDAFAVLTEAGPLGLFALYLLISQRKLQERSDKAISELRDRYDSVVEKQDRTIDSLTMQIGTKVDRLLDKVGIAPPPPPPPARVGALRPLPVPPPPPPAPTSSIQTAPPDGFVHVASAVNSW